MVKLNPDMLAAFRLNGDALRAGIVFLVMNGTIYAYEHAKMTPALLERYRQHQTHLREILISMAIP